MGQTLFISDLHLSGETPETVARFSGFCDRQARGSDALYILGDLFDTWIGDDDDSPPAPEVRKVIRTLVDGGTPVFLQHGNRDFLIGKRFCDQTGATLLPEESVIDLYGRRALLMHGDILCTDDVGYQQARLMLRNPDFIRNFLSKSLPERAAIAAAYRQQSGEATSLLADDIMDVNAGAVADALERHGADCLIHGHTHRLGRHEIALAGRAAERIVLGEWHPERGSCLVATAGDLVLTDC